MIKLALNFLPTQDFLYRMWYTSKDEYVLDE